MAQVQLGKWFTRNNRLVVIDSQKEIEDSPSPGMPPTKRMVWEGMMYAADGKTESSRCTWEADGMYKTPLNVASQFDLVQLIEAAPAPEPDPEPFTVPIAEFKPEDEQDEADEYEQLMDLLEPHKTDDDQSSAQVLQGLIKDATLARPILEALVPHYDASKDTHPHDTLKRLLEELQILREMRNVQPEKNADVIIVPDQTSSGSTVETQTAEGAAQELSGQQPQ